MKINVPHLYYFSQKRFLSGIPCFTWQKKNEIHHRRILGFWMIIFTFLHFLAVMCNQEQNSKSNTRNTSSFLNFPKKYWHSKPPWRPFVYFQDQRRNPSSHAPHSQALLIFSRIQFGALPRALQIDYETFRRPLGPKSPEMQKEDIDTREQARKYISWINQCTWDYSSYNSIKRTGAVRK